MESTIYEYAVFVLVMRPRHITGPTIDEPTGSTPLRREHFLRTKYKTTLSRDVVWGWRSERYPVCVDLDAIL